MSIGWAAAPGWSWVSRSRHGRDNVRVFLAVARAGQFVAAARKLGLDHATASRRVSSLEAALGAKLFDRLTTGAKLTSAGERFFAAAEQMETAFLHAQAEVSDVDVELSGDVRIGAPDGFSTYYLAGALRSFTEKYPGVRVQLAPLPQLTPLARRELDIVIGIDKPETGRFVARRLTDYSLGIYASAEYLERRGAPADVGDLVNHRLIGYVEEYAFSTALDYVRELYGGQPTQFECANAVTQFEALRAGSGSASPTTTSRGASPTSSACCPSGARCGPTGSSPTRTRAAWDESARRTNTSWRAWSAIEGRSCEQRYASSHNSSVTALLSRFGSPADLAKTLAASSPLGERTPSLQARDLVSQSDLHRLGLGRCAGQRLDLFGEFVGFVVANVQRHFGCPGRFRRA